MKKWLCYVLFFVLILGMSGKKADAQGSLQFPTNRKDISKALNKLGKPKSFGPAKTMPDGIVEDKPRVGALIQFDFDSSAVSSESEALLKEFGASFQQDLPEAVFVIEGHADSKGTDEYNMRLSRRRAEAVRQFLTDVFQIDRSRLIIRAYGERRPIATNDTEGGRSLNRRVEFVRDK